jgi:hypothetical protein
MIYNDIPKMEDFQNLLEDCYMILSEAYTSNNSKRVETMDKIEEIERKISYWGLETHSTIYTER